MKKKESSGESIIYYLSKICGSALKALIVMLIAPACLVSLGLLYTGVIYISTIMSLEFFILWCCFTIIFICFLILD